MQEYSWANGYGGKGTLPFSTLLRFIDMCKEHDGYNKLLIVFLQFRACDKT